MNTVAVALALLAAPPDRITVHPADTGVAMCNPDMGWVFHYYDNVPTNYGSRLEPSDTLPDFPGLTGVYLRIPWSYLEPEEGQFNWATVDGPAQRWIAAGKQVAFRFSCAESWMRWATPEWVMKAGAKGFNFTPGKGVVEDGPFWEPDYDDPVFLDKLDHFLAACAARYDGDPSVAFFDVGSFGVWGEGHTYASSGRPWSAETVERHIALHQKQFHHTLLAANDDFSSQGRGDDVVKWAAEQGLALRDDSILVQAPPNAYFHANFADWFWRDQPVILESEHYGGSRDRGCWGDGHWYLQAVEDYHASWCSIHWWPREFLTECRELIDRMNLRMGYRLQLAEASWPGRLRVGDDWHFASTWRNAGVAPCYPGGRVAVTLKDAKGGIVNVFVVPGFDARALPTAAPGQAPARPAEADFTLPFDFHAGTYDVFVSVGDAVGTPKLELPLADHDGGKRYRIGRLEVTADYAVSAGPPARAGDGWRLPLAFTTHGPLPGGIRPFVHFDDDRGNIAFQAVPADGSD
ncbi:MAG: DUF4832 domain-containing protein, partial [Armatimonadetes bacterium]|nr:DUF4832 domain-containing protein [Armatimonadota bacterium]